MFFRFIHRLRKQFHTCGLRCQGSLRLCLPAQDRLPKSLRLFCLFRLSGLPAPSLTIKRKDRPPGYLPGGRHSHSNGFSSLFRFGSGGSRSGSAPVTVTGPSPQKRRLIAFVQKKYRGIYLFLFFILGIYREEALKSKL